MKRLLIACFLLVAFSLAAISQTKKIIVSKDGKGDCKTVQEAINAVPDSSNSETIIYIKNGVYKEKLRLPETKSKVHFVGESVEGTILTYDDYASKKDSTGQNIGTSGSSSFFVFGNDFTAENITFENSSGPVGQAVAIRVTGDRAKFINCRFLGFQDTLYTQGDNSRQYYYKCYIEGTVDFIFGAATAVFDNCTLFAKNGGYYTAAATPEGKKFGYVFLNCKLTGNAPNGSFLLGRPWRPFAKVVYINCFLDQQVKSEGWDNWGKVDNEKSTFYAEYKSYGPGAASDKRVVWSHQLSAQDASQYTVSNILGDWKI
ncbi:pectinesterase family protein [Pinibacter aurantiacus]|uniref:Pectinesterase n=1 Tax=Pinibacter aurantiacus TaxID=2851599 RepID=A0A9E2SA60_9BACT|nr:pectinesterase family protein [Pinibacter aurantiacus]MBV4357534.1 pectin esterase [Pinibacter aurantiacus]